MMLGDSHRVTDWFFIHFTENNGMAFGTELGGDYGKLFLTLFRIVAVIAISFWLRNSIRKGAHGILTVSVSFILAGAIGNILDSVFYGVIFDHSFGQVATFMPDGGGYAPLLYGKVVDMLYFPLWKGFLPEWLPIWGGEYFVFFQPIFNIADVAITVGVALLLIFQKQAFPERNTLEKSEKYVA